MAGLLWSAIIAAQVSSPDADASRTIAYKSYTGNDRVFVYYENPGDSRTGNLRVDHPGDNSFDFEWAAFDTIAGDWGPVFYQESGVEFSQNDNLDEGGYRIRVQDGALVDTFYYAWVFMDNLVASVLKTNDDRIVTGKFTCDFIILNGTVTPDRFYYYDPVTLERIELSNGASFLWTSDNEELIIPNDDRVLSPNTSYNPPVVDTWYILTATDSFGMTDVDSVFYETINVRSEFSFEFLNREDNIFEEPPTPTEGDAPLRVRFTNESVNGFSYEWIFEDSAVADLPETELTEDFDYQPEYDYRIPDDYYPKLVAKSRIPNSNQNCIDTFKLDDPIIVRPSELEAPNVFTPGGQNPYFKVKFQSIKEFHIRIYSRTGHLVYKADVTDMYSWEGWDGSVLNSDRPAAPGAYFYVIEATGYDEVRYNKGPYKGVVYLFR